VTRDRSTSVVVCAYTEDRFDDLKSAIDSVRAQTTPPLEIVLVVDHNESLLVRATSSFPDVIVVANAGRQGLSDARNTGVRATHGSIVAFLDDDAQAAPDWLANLMDAYRDPAVIGAGGFAAPHWDGGRPSWFPEEFDWVVGCSYRGLPTSVSAVRNVLGCNMSFRREAFDVAGAFSSKVGRVGTRPVGGEETEFCIRLASRLPDARILYQPTARVLHRVPAARGTWSYFRTRCIMEGVSKATVADLSGGGKALSTERRYVLLTLPSAVARGVLATVTLRDPAGIVRAGAVIAGLLLTTAGYLSGRGGVRARRGKQPAVNPQA
jgi:GT2 family glycosyltransferase